MVFEASENLPEQVARVIGYRIIRNQLKPGERILEAKLAEAMGVSRSPLREALRILEKQKLVELIPRKGAKVTKISASHIIWFYDIFEALYALAARESAEKADDEDRSALRMALQRIENAAAERDIEAYYSACCGGVSSQIEEVWAKEARPYLISRPDTPAPGGQAYCADWIAAQKIDVCPPAMNYLG